MTPDVVQAIRSAFERGIDDELAAAMLELGASFNELDRTLALTADVRAMPADWIESRIRTGYVVEAACGIAAIAEAYVAVGRADAAVAELVAFVETLAATFAALSEETRRKRDADFEARVRAAMSPCPRPRRSRWDKA